MTGIVSLHGTIAHPTDAVAVAVGQHWIAVGKDGVTAITIMRAVDEGRTAWLVDTSTGRPRTMTGDEIVTGYRLVRRLETFS